MTQRACRICHGFHDLNEPWPDSCSAHWVSYSAPARLHVVRDIQPYKSMVTGEMITSRSQHRDHLARHNCIEIGNDTSHMNRKPVQPKTNRKESLSRMLGDMSDRQANKLIKKAIAAQKAGRP